ncbi:MAG: DUF1684 domain-containing protein [Bacteroidia bacterium]|nr:DUF1684 domain-containing protein [Bacteroidia bacterium]
MRPLLSWKAVAFLIGLIIFALLLWPHRPISTPTTSPSCQWEWSRYETALSQARKHKDSLFLVDPRSPIPQQEKNHFRGLKYFPPDSQWRLRGRYEALKNALAPMVGVAWLHLPTLDGCKGPSKLLVYGEKTGSLYVAFWDSTAHTGLTYEGGRYVPVEVVGESACVDFNRAYFPYCAYNPSYICLPYPPENRLCLPVLAGERW